MHISFIFFSTFDSFHSLYWSTRSHRAGIVPMRESWRSFLPEVGLALKCGRLIVVRPTAAFRAFFIVIFKLAILYHLQDFQSSWCGHHSLLRRGDNFSSPDLSVHEASRLALITVVFFFRGQIQRYLEHSSSPWQNSHSKWLKILFFFTFRWLRSLQSVRVVPLELVISSNLADFLSFLSSMGCGCVPTL